MEFEKVGEIAEICLVEAFNYRKNRGKLSCCGCVGIRCFLLFTKFLGYFQFELAIVS